MPGRHFKGLAPKEVYMNKNALFCDGTSDYVIPAEPGIHEKVRLRFRTARDDAQEVCLISGGETLQMQKCLIIMKQKCSLQIRCLFIIFG